MYLSGYLKIHTVSAWTDWSPWKACMKKEKDIIDTKPSFRLALYGQGPFCHTME